jgi:anaerobic magnesium-protoporphyrin IX monomethyl ester cyclase
MKRVVLIYPHYYPYSQYVWMPTGMIHLAAPLVSEGYECVFIDDNLLTDSETLGMMQAYIPEAAAVLVSCACGSQLKNARILMNTARTLAPNTKIIVGGPFPSAKPDLMMTDPNADHVVMGRGEDFIIPLVRDGGWYPGRVFGRSFDNPLPHPIRESYPLPYYDMLGFSPGDYLSPARALNYTASTGCVGHCAFCFWPESTDYRPIPVDTVMGDLWDFVDHDKIENILFDDPTFFVSPTIQRPLIQRLGELGCKWRANARVDRLRDFSIEDMKRAHESGCHVIHIGMESGSDSVLARMHKGGRARDVLDLAPISWETGITLRFHILLGTPGETLEELKETADLVEEMRGRFRDFDYTVGFFTPYAGCDMANQAKAFGWQEPQTLREWELFEATNNKNHLPKSDREIVKETDPWKEDMDIPGARSPHEYMRRFREWIPERSTIESTGGKRETFYRD